MHKELTKLQHNHTVNTALNIIHDLPPKAVAQLLEGYENDYDRLMKSVFEQVSMVMNMSRGLETEKLEYLDQVEASMDKSLKKLSYNYFKTTCLPRFRQEWRNLEFGNIIQLYNNVCILAQRGSGKCLSPGTEVVMYDGSIKNIEDIVVGDKLMGRDNTPRKVLSLHSGEDEMYEIEQKLFQSYTVNSRHDVYFKKWSSLYNKDKGRSIRCYDEEKAIDVKIEAKDFYEKSSNKNYMRDVFGVGINGWELPYKNLLIEPYFLGIWLGDGCKGRPEIASADKEIIDYFYDYADRLGLDILHPELSILYRMVAPSWVKPNAEGINVMINRLKHYNLLNNKHIPEDYLTCSKKQRFELLAGLIDSDGHNPKDKKNSIVFIQKNIKFVKQVQKLCWSLGFRANYKEYAYKTKATKCGEATTAQLYISGNLSQIPCKLPRKLNLHDYEVSTSKSPQRRGINIKPVGKGKYYGFTCDKDHMFLLSDGTVLSNSYETTYALPLWRMYSYDQPNFFQKDTIDNHNRKETLLVTNIERLANEHATKVIEEIRFNDVIAEKLNPNGKATLGTTKIISETGSMLDCGGFFGFLRGKHKGGIVLDDCISESSLYSQEQREKSKERFYGTISPILEPGGLFVVSGTPYSELDLYGSLRKDKSFKVFEYPAVMPDGRLLSPDRFTFEKLSEIRESVGSIVFSREYLVTPISSDSSIFPRQFLERSIVGMENVKLANNINEFPFKLKKVVLACDFAISGTVGADYSVFVAMGIDVDENYYLIDVWRKQSSSFEEQVNQIVSMNQRFKPNQIVCETNGFQRLMGDMVKKRGIRNVKEFVTTSKVKKDSYDGLPSISAFFERGQIRIPYGEGRSREIAEIIFTEFASIGYIEDKGKLESTGAHDDTSMAIFFAMTELRENTTKFRAYNI